MTPKVYLTRSNLMALLAKLDAVKANKVSLCTILKHDMDNTRYPQTHPTIIVTAVEDELYYYDRMPGPMVPVEMLPEQRL